MRKNRRKRRKKSLKEKNVGRRGRKEKKNEIEKKENFKITFWHVAGLKNKDRDFLLGLEEWDVIILMGIWIDENGREKIKTKLPKRYRWENQMPEKKNKKK